MAKPVRVVREGRALAESHDADGTLEYHHFAFEGVIDGQVRTIRSG